MVSARRKVNLGTMSAILLVVLLIFAKSQSFTVGEEISDFSHLDSACNITSCSDILEDKRGVPTGANPLHNRIYKTVYARLASTSNLGLQFNPKSASTEEKPLSCSCFWHQSGKMNISSDCTEEVRCREVDLSSSFCRSVYSEIEEVGWEHLVKLDHNHKFLSFRILDKKGRAHIMEIELEKAYPRCPPSISADVPYTFNLEWSVNSRLKHVVQQFQEHLEKLQEFWCTMDNIDKSLWVVYPKEPSQATSCREINLGNDCFIMLSINVNDPRSLPECRFMGSDPIVNSLRKKWRRNSKRWMKDKSLIENLASAFETSLPGPPDVHKNDQQVECGICYAHFLPIDEELGAKSGSGTDYTCENTSCSRAFHSVCLGDWLRSITTTRQSFNVLFGNCPYCSDPVAVKISDTRK